MLLSYLKTAVRSLLRQGTYASINIAGLAWMCPQIGYHLYQSFPAR